MSTLPNRSAATVTVPPPPAGTLLRAGLLRALIFMGLWWVLAEGSAYGLGLAALTILATVGTSLALMPPAGWRLRPLAVLRFVPFFLRESIRGGIDAGWRAMHPRLPIEPGYVDFRMRLVQGPARTFFASSLNLLPGTVTVDAEGADLRIQVLDTDQAVTESLRRLEVHVANVFGEVLPSEDGS